jgi:hypothetical protein
VVDGAGVMNQEDILINDFAARSFRDIGDMDYIAARIAFRSKLAPQFLWSGLQCIEKYLKFILLVNRIPAKRVGHDLLKSINLIERHAPFKLCLTAKSHELIDHLNDYGQVRYLEVPFWLTGYPLLQLDLAVWEIRRYCRVLNYSIIKNGSSNIPMLNEEIRKIEDSSAKTPISFSIIGGALEKILDDRKHPAREHLIWKNLFFGSRRRKNVKMHWTLHFTNSPLSLHPEILDQVLKYVHLPDRVCEIYRPDNSE